MTTNERNEIPDDTFAAHYMSLEIQRISAEHNEEHDEENEEEDDEEYDEEDDKELAA